MKKLDTQIIELLGRNRLVDDILRGGLEVAMPARDSGIDLIVFFTGVSDQSRFCARPIQLKASSKESFGIHQKYEKFPDMLIAHVWHVNTREDIEVYVMSYRQSIQIGDAMGWTEKPSWRNGKAYTTSSPSKKLKDLMLPFLTTADDWKTIINKQLAKWLTKGSVNRYATES